MQTFREPAPVVETPQDVHQARVRLPTVALIVAGFILMAGAIAGTQLVWARHHLVQGAQDLNGAIATVRSPTALESPAQRAAAISDLVGGQEEFARARSDLVIWGPVSSRLGWVPRIGPELAAVAPAADAAYYATSSALDVVRGLTGLWPFIRRHSHSRPLLPELATALAGGHQDFVAAQSTGLQGVAQLVGLPATTGNPTLDRAATKLRRDLPRLVGASGWLAVAPSLLGTGSPAQYLFCWENSQEIRAVGGFIGASELVTLHGGHMTKRFTGSALRHEIPFRHPPIPEAALTNETTWLFRDSNFSPDFPTSARLERWFYGRDTGTWVTTVVDFVDQGVPDVLRATGPVYIPQYHVTVNAKNAEALATRFAGPRTGGYRGPRRPGAVSLDTYRKQFLGYEFAAIVGRLQHLPVNRWTHLASALGDAVGRHDILVYDRRPAVEDAIRSSGAGGTLNVVPGDYVYIVDDNRSYNKISPFVHESATYVADILPNLWLNSTLTIHYHLNPSPPDLEGEGPRFGQAGNKHDFRDFVRVYLPAGAVIQPLSPNDSGIRFVTQYPVQLAYGFTQVSGWFQMRPRHSHTVTIQYQTPANALAFANFTQYRLTVPRQPGATLSRIGVSIQGIDGVTLVSPNGRRLSSYRQTLVLTRDRQLALGIAGGGHADLVPLPPATLADPFIQWKWLKDRRHPL